MLRPSEGVVVHIWVGGSMVSWKVQTLKSDLLPSEESLSLPGPQFPPSRMACGKCCSDDQSSG